MSHLKLALPLLLILVHCAGVRPAPDPSPSLTGGSSVRVVRGDGSARELGAGQMLPLAEKLELELAVATPAYVYLILFAPASESQFLFPVGEGGQAGVRLQAGERRRFTFEHPERSYKDATTDVHLFVVASPTPLGPALCTLLRLRCTTSGPLPTPRGNGAESPPPPPPPPPREAKADRRPVQPGDEKRDPACVTMVNRSDAGVHNPVLIVPVVLNYQAANSR